MRGPNGRSRSGGGSWIEQFRTITHSPGEVGVIVVAVAIVGASVFTVVNGTGVQSALENSAVGREVVREKMASGGGIRTSVETTTTARAEWSYPALITTVATADGSRSAKPTTKPTTVTTKRPTAAPSTSSATTSPTGPGATTDPSGTSTRPPVTTTVTGSPAPTLVPTPDPKPTSSPDPTANPTPGQPTANPAPGQGGLTPPRPADFWDRDGNVRTPWEAGDW